MRAVVTSLLKDQGDYQPLGKKWFQGFFDRNKEVKTKLGRRQSYKRLNGARPSKINAFFDLYATVS